MSGELLGIRSLIPCGSHLSLPIILRHMQMHHYYEGGYVQMGWDFLSFICQFLHASQGKWTGPSKDESSPHHFTLSALISHRFPVPWEDKLYWETVRSRQHIQKIFCSMFLSFFVVLFVLVYKGSWSCKLVSKLLCSQGLSWIYDPPASTFLAMGVLRLKMCIIMAIFMRQCWRLNSGLHVH